MKPWELTEEMVRRELESLIRDYPDNRGSVKLKIYFEDGSDPDFYEEDETCVYFTDAKGSPVVSAPYNTSLVNPICVIGTWIQKFHPEFKQEPLVRNFLVLNRTIGRLDEDNPFPPDVTVLLTNAQDTQDRGGSWENIDLDVNPVSWT